MSDRHEKWTPVAPGTVIPAGQPYAEVRPLGHPSDWTPHPEDNVIVDSLWKPPLVLPNEPTWGIVVHGVLTFTDRWYLNQTAKRLITGRGASLRPNNVRDFIPLTTEQVARIEAAR